MPYGRPTSSGHGYRRPDYIWSPVLMPFPRRRKRQSASSKTRHPSTRTAKTPGLVEDIAVSALDGLMDILFNGPRSQAGAKLLGSMFLVAVMSQSMTTLALGLIALFCRLAKESVNYATNEVVNGYKERIKVMQINRKTSVNPPPTPEAIRKAWEASRKTLMGKLLVGTLLSDLEPVVDQSYVRTEDGTIVGRRPGIKGWLLQNCPDMLPHYKAMMNYKALADKLRKALGIEEPDTLAEVLDFAKLEKEQPKSLLFLDDFKLLKSNRRTVMENSNIFLKDFGEKGTPTMAALDAVLRERLELVWMRRARKRPSAA